MICYCDKLLENESLSLIFGNFSMKNYEVFSFTSKLYSIPFIGTKIWSYFNDSLSYNFNINKCCRSEDNSLKKKDAVQADIFPLIVEVYNDVILKN